MNFCRKYRSRFFRLAVAPALAVLLGAQLAGQAAPTPGNTNSPAPLTPITLAPPAHATQPQGTAKAPDIRDIHDPAALTYWERHGTQIILGSVGGVALLAGLMAFLLRKKPQVVLTPYERALKELEVARGLQTTGQDKVFAIAASDAVRRYLEDAYKMPAPERTTEEFLQEASQHAWLEGELTVLLKRFLEFCDLAKFAGQEFGDEERGQLLEAAREFLAAAEKLRQPSPEAKGQTIATPTTPPAPTLSAP